MLLYPQPDATMPRKAPVREGVATHPGLIVYALLILSDLDREEVDGVSLPGRLSLCLGLGFRVLGLGLNPRP